MKADFDYLALNNVVSILSSEPAGASCLFTLVERHEGREGGREGEGERGWWATASLRGALSATEARPSTCSLGCNALT